MFIDEIARQLQSSGAKLVITSCEISSTVMTAVNKSIPGAKVIVVNDYTKPVPDGVIPFEVCDNVESSQTAISHLKAKMIKIFSYAILLFSYMD